MTRYILVDTYMCHKPTKMPHWKEVYQHQEATVTFWKGGMGKGWSGRSHYTDGTQIMMIQLQNFSTL